MRAWIAWERGRAEEALRHLDQLRPEAWRLRGESGGLGVDGMQVWLRAEVLARLGHDTEALQLYAPLGFMWGDAGMLAAKHLRMAEIHDRRGARAEAVRHYERFIEIWQDCDAEARDSIRRAEQRLTALRSGR